MKIKSVGSSLVLLAVMPVIIMANSIGISPVNEKFNQWQNQTDKSHTVVIDGIIRGTGAIPSPLQEEVYVGGIVPTATYPAKFDLSDPNLDGFRNDSLMTPVGNQGECGVCWAFAGLNGSYEGQLSVGGLGTFDFSEQNVRYTNGTDNDPCSGNNLGTVIAYLARGSGPVAESDDPYDLSDGNTYNPDAKAVRYMDNILELPLRDINNKTDIDYIKNVVYNLNKPLYVTVQVGQGTAGETGTSVWDAETNSFYCEGNETSPTCPINHAVTIVGWDDNYEAQGQTGAFILKNSWGSSWGEEGYFYVPYNDDSIGLSSTIAYYDDKENIYDNTNIDIYQHDSLTVLSGYGYSDETPGYGANVFTVTKSGTATAVGLYVRRAQTSYEIKLFKSVQTDGTVTFSEQIGATQSGTAALRGWHTMELDVPADVREGEKLVVQVKMSNANGFPLPLEKDYLGFVDVVSAPGESYWSSDGINFDDIYDFSLDDWHFAIKVLVEPNNVVNMAPIISYLLSDTVSPTALKWKQISVGAFHTVAIKPDGTLWTWGLNDNGQLGDGTNSNRQIPVQESTGATNWSSVSAGDYHTVALKSDGTLWSWGRNFNGEIGDGTTTDRYTPTQESTGATNWNIINAGGYNTFALKTDGTLWAWGYNLYGQVGDGTTTNRSVPTQESTGATNWSNMSGGAYHTVALKVDGSLWSWGDNRYSQLGDGTSTNRSTPTQESTGATDWSLMNAGGWHTVAIKNNGTLWSWGYNEYGGLGDGTTTDRSTPTQESTGATNWNIVEGGGVHTIALKSDGTLWLWGYNEYGQLGDGTTTDRSTPTQESTGSTNWVSLDAGAYHTAAIKSDETLWTWGRNDDGQLGDGTVVDRNVPTLILSLD